MQGGVRGVVACGIHGSRGLSRVGKISEEEEKVDCKSLCRLPRSWAEKGGASTCPETWSDGASWDAGFRLGLFTSPGGGWGGKARKTAGACEEGPGCRPYLGG